MRPALFHGWLGLGDTIYYRPAVRAQSSHRAVYVETAWPELFTDLGVHLVRPDTQYRTQRKNIERQPPDIWRAPPPDHERIRPRQVWPRGASIPSSVANSVDMFGEPYRLDLPPLEPLDLPFEHPRFAVIRPVTLRKEWLNRARAPDPAYVAAAAVHLREAGFMVVSVADVDGEEEWTEEPTPVADYSVHAGELDTTELLRLVAHADLVVGGVGWIVPACLATSTPLVVIGGGCGFYNHPNRLTGPLVDSSRARWILPDHYCMCGDPVHRCPKAIPDFGARFAAAVEDLRRPQEEGG